MAKPKNSFVKASALLKSTPSAMNISKDVFDDSMNAHMLNMESIDVEDKDSGLSSGTQTATTTPQSSQGSATSKRFSFNKRKWSPNRQLTLNAFFGKSSENEGNKEAEENGDDERMESDEEDDDDEIVELFNSSKEDCKKLPAQAQISSEVVVNGETAKLTEEMNSLFGESDVEIVEIPNPRKRSREEISSPGDLKKSPEDGIPEEPKPKTAKNSHEDSSSGCISDAKKQTDRDYHVQQKEGKDKNQNSTGKSSKPALKKPDLIVDLFGDSATKKSENQKMKSESDTAKKAKESHKVEHKDRSSSSSSGAHGGEKKRSSDSSLSGNQSSQSSATTKIGSSSSGKTGSGNSSMTNGVSKSSSSTSSNSKTIGKQEMAEIVISFLMPYFKNKKIESKEKFKLLARDYSHQAIKRGLKSKFN